MELDESIVDALTRTKFDAVFPVLHGPPGEDGTFQGFLDILHIPYVGSGVRASACAMDKIAAKRMFSGFGLPIAKDTIIKRGESFDKAILPLCVDADTKWVIKPSRSGSALGVRIGVDPDDLPDALEEAFQYDERILIEQYIEGKEITVAVLESDEIKALPVIEIRTPEGSWYDYDHRYTKGFSEHIIPAPLPEQQYKRTSEIAILAHQCLRCRDLSRVDFVVPEEGEPILLEINTMPGMTPTSLFPDAALAAGISFEALTSYLIERALRRSG
jgi:D-alanine-D-alanine ligase